MSDINDDSDENIHGIARSIAKLPAAKIEIVKSVFLSQFLIIPFYPPPPQVKILFEMLYQLATTPDNDANIAQLIMSIAPAIYKPVDTCYMSIRHMELLKLIRPVFQFITEHHAEIMRFVGPSKYQSSSQVAEALPSNITERLQQLQKISSAGSVPNVPSSGVPSIPPPASVFTPTKPLPISPQLQLHIHATMEVEGAENPYPEDLLNLSTHIASHPPNFHSQEWKILELLVNSRLDLWLKQGYTGASNLWDTEVSVGGSRPSPGPVRRNADDLRLYDSDEDEKDPRARTGQQSQRKGRGESRRGEERRILVAECKSLRLEVSVSWLRDLPDPPLLPSVDPELRRENETREQESAICEHLPPPPPPHR
jgi:hypothetical protein